MHDSIYYFLFGGIALICALAFTPFGALKYLKGIRTLPKEERDKIRLKALGFNLTVMMGILSAIFFLSGAVEFFREVLSKWFLIGWFVLAFADAMFISRSKYYFKDKNSGGGEK